MAHPGSRLARCASSGRVPGPRLNLPNGAARSVARDPRLGPELAHGLVPRFPGMRVCPGAPIEVPWACLELRLPVPDAGPWHRRANGRDRRCRAPGGGIVGVLEALEALEVPGGPIVGVLEAPVSVLEAPPDAAWVCRDFPLRVPNAGPRRRRVSGWNRMCSAMGRQVAGFPETVGVPETRAREEQSRCAYVPWLHPRGLAGSSMDRGRKPGSPFVSG